MKHKGYQRIVLCAIAFLVMMYTSGALAVKAEQFAVDSGALRMEEVSGYGLDFSKMNMKVHE